MNEEQRYFVNIILIYLASIYSDSVFKNENPTSDKNSEMKHLNEKYS
jgi:hypothetical protein